MASWETIKDEGLKLRLKPVFEGLQRAHKGEKPGVVFLGWTVGRHWVLAPKEEKKTEEAKAAAPAGNKL